MLLTGLLHANVVTDKTLRQHHSFKKLIICKNERYQKLPFAHHLLV